MKTVEEKMRENTAENIRRFGQHIAAVFPRQGDEGDSFFYTIGNAERKLPELLLMGNFPSEFAAGLLNALASQMWKSEKPLPEGMVDLGYSFPFKIRRAGPAAKELTAQVDRYYGDVAYDVLQVMICDTEGVYQDDPKCRYAAPTP